MTTRYSRWTFRLGAVGVILGCCAIAATKVRGKYVAHEWGTFTSVQGADGKLLQWHPLESSHLPKFVYDWRHPGEGRRDASGISSLKSSVASLQRMETPVIYFYSDHNQTVDVSVHFPQGIITEWYP